MIKFFKLLATLKYIWSFWNLRLFVVFSFLLQCILIIGSSLRVQTSIKFIHRLIWLVYLLADWVAYYAIGLVVPINRLKDQLDTYEIHSFWAPFLLMHIGGPNTIAGFSLEDNELWDRSVLHILVQAGATGISIYRSLSKKRLLAPTLLVLVAALTRYIGRILALNNGSMDVLREEIVASKKHNNDIGDGDHEDNLIAIPMSNPNRMREVEPVILAAHSYDLFKKYKVIFCGLSIETSREVSNDRDELFSKKPSQAFIEMEMELSLAYDLFYTKIWTLVEDRAIKILHYVSFASEVGALVLWALANKDGYHKVDIKLTNALLIGGIFLNVVSMLKLAFSDLAICHFIKCKRDSPFVVCAMNKLLSIRNRAKRFPLFRRWSGTINQFDLINYNEPRCCGCSKKCVEWVNRLIGKEHGVERVYLSEGMKIQIFMGIRDRGLHYKGRKQKKTKLSIGQYVLDMYDQNEPIGNAIQHICKRIGVVDALIIWHTATNLYCSKNNTEEDSELRQCNKQISEYMMYLLFHRPQMILEGLQLDMTVEDMTQRLKEFLEGCGRKEFVEVAKKDRESEHFDWKREMRDEEKHLDEEEKDLEEIMKICGYSLTPVDEHGLDVRRIRTEEESELVNQNADLEVIVKGSDHGKAASMDVIKKLADYIEYKLEKVGHPELIMNEIWFDFLLYVAIRCKGRLHVQGLGNGGELLTIVCLMMTHLRLTIEVPRNH